MYRVFAVLLCLCLFQFNITFAIDYKQGAFYQFEHEKDFPNDYFYDVDGKKVFLSSYRNKVVLLYFWATWCSACAHKIKELQTLKNKLNNDNFKIIPLSEDYNGTSAVIKFYKNNSINDLDIFIDRNNYLYRKHNITFMPHAILINHKQKEVARINTKAQYDSSSIINLVSKYLEEIRN